MTTSLSTRRAQCDRWRSSRMYFHKNLYTSKLEPIGMWKAFALKGAKKKKSFDKTKKVLLTAARLINVPVTFSGTKPFLNNDYKKSCKPSLLSGSAFYQKRFHCENHSYWSGMDMKHVRLLCYVLLAFLDLTVHKVKREWFFLDSASVK